MTTTQVDLVTPSGVIFSGQAQMVVCRTEGGEIAFLANHMPFIGALDPCVTRVVGIEDEANRSSGQTELSVAVHGGFVEVHDNKVTLLADIAELSDEIDLARAKRALSEAQAFPEDDVEAKAAQRRAEVRIEAATAS